MITQAIREFYSEINFPGRYSRQALEYHCPDIRNPYLAVIDREVQQHRTVLDVGCGTGLITNLLALRYPNKDFTAIDFSSSLDWARNFGQDNEIQNVRYLKQDFLSWQTQDRYDCIICQGVLHHIPDIKSATSKLQQYLAPGGTLCLAVYHPWGKILKRLMAIDYGSEVLRRDQEEHPYETSFSERSVRGLFADLYLVEKWPTNTAWHAISQPLAFSRNGGLVSYVFKNSVLQ